MIKNTKEVNNIIVKNKKMTIETKREMIKYKMFNEDINCDINTYYLIRFDLFDNIIKKIDDDSFYVKGSSKYENISVDQFINLLDYFVKKIRALFFNSIINEFTISYILCSNMELTNKYFDFKGRVTFENSKDLNEIINKLIITNFISNAQYINSIKSLLNNNNIELKSINDYSDKEIHKIVSIMSQILFCEKALGKSDCLFINIEEELKRNIKCLKENRKHKYIDKEYRNKCQIDLLQYFNKNYTFLINNYNKKKQYIKYFY